MKEQNLTVLFLEREIEGRKRARDNKIEFAKTLEKEKETRQEWIDRETGIIDDMENAVKILSKEK